MYKIPANTVFIGKDIKYLPHCHSTNDSAAENLQNGEAIHGQVIITDHQTKGRGQTGNTWYSAANQNLTFSIILLPNNFSISDQFHLHYISSIALFSFFKRLGISISVKWPNDIFYGDKKLGGILIQNSIQGKYITDSVVGMGININQETFSLKRAISLSNITGRKYNLQELLPTLLKEFELAYSLWQKGRLTEIREQYESLLFRKNELKSFFDKKEEEQIEGIIKGVEPTGELLLQVDGQIRKYSPREIDFIFS